MRVRDVLAWGEEIVMVALVMHMQICIYVRYVTFLAFDHRIRVMAPAAASSMLRSTSVRPRRRQHARSPCMYSVERRLCGIPAAVRTARRSAVPHSPNVGGLWRMFSDVEIAALDMDSEADTRGRPARPSSSNGSNTPSSR